MGEQNACVIAVGLDKAIKILSVVVEKRHGGDQRQLECWPSVLSSRVGSSWYILENKFDVGIGWLARGRNGD